MLKLECETTPEQIRLAEDKLLEIAVERGADQLHQSRMLLVLDELLTNIRRYAYPGKPGPVRIDVLPRVGDGDNLLHLLIHDWGPSFNPLNDSNIPQIDADLDSRLPGGLGLYLVYNMVCGMRYDRVWEQPPSSGRNQLCLSFPLTGPADE